MHAATAIRGIALLLFTSALTIAYWALTLTLKPELIPVAPPTFAYDSPLVPIPRHAELLPTPRHAPQRAASLPIENETGDATTQTDATARILSRRKPPALDRETLARAMRADTDDPPAPAPAETPYARWPPRVTALPAPPPPASSDPFSLSDRTMSQLRFLLPLRIPGEAPRAQAHLLELLRVARALGRTLVLPHVGAGRVGACRRFGFGAYFDEQELVRWLAQDDAGAASSEGEEDTDRKERGVGGGEEQPAVVSMDAFRRWMAKRSEETTGQVLSLQPVEKLASPRAGVLPDEEAMHGDVDSNAARHVLLHIAAGDSVAESTAPDGLFLLAHSQTQPLPPMSRAPDLGCLPGKLPRLRTGAFPPVTLSVPRTASDRARRGGSGAANANANADREAAVHGAGGALIRLLRRAESRNGTEAGAEAGGALRSPEERAGGALRAPEEWVSDGGASGALTRHGDDAPPPGEHLTRIGYGSDDDRTLGLPKERLERAGASAPADESAADAFRVLAIGAKENGVTSTKDAPSGVPEFGMLSSAERAVAGNPSTSAAPPQLSQHSIGEAAPPPQAPAVPERMPSALSAHFGPDVLVVSSVLRHALFPGVPEVRLPYAPALHDTADRLARDVGALAFVRWRTAGVMGVDAEGCARELVRRVRKRRVGAVWLAVDGPGTAPILEAVRAVLASGNGVYTGNGIELVDLPGAFEGLFGAARAEDDVELLLRLDEDLLQDAGARGIIERLVAMRAEVFMATGKMCGKTE